MFKIMQNIIDKIRSLFLRPIIINVNAYAKLIPRSSLNVFSIHLVDHCNLNCKGCSHFSPIAEEHFVNEEIFTAEMQRMSELFYGYVGQITLLGGEPLLHPNIAKLLKIVRNNFPLTGIVIITNALKLKAMTNDFWESCRENNVKIAITKYPVIKDYGPIEKILLNNSIEYEYMYCEDSSKTFEKIPIEISGCLDGSQMWLQCYKSARCIMLKDGRLYPCTFAPNVHHFSKKFGVSSIVEVPEDSIDIYTHTRNEILEFLTHPIPMCRFCNIPQTKRKIPYGRSECKIDEWI